MNRRLLCLLATLIWAPFTALAYGAFVGARTAAFIFITMMKGASEGHWPWEAEICEDQDCEGD